MLTASNAPVSTFKFVDGVHVAFIGLGCNLSDRHVLGPPPTQQMHCLVDHRDAPVFSEVGSSYLQDRTLVRATGLVTVADAAIYRASGLVP